MFTIQGKPVILGALFLLVSLVHMSGSAQTMPMSPQPPGHTIEPSTQPLGIQDDANSGNVFVAPTALMPQKGTFSFTSTELLFVGLSYAFSDHFLMSAHTLIPINSGAFQPYLLSAKLGVFQNQRLHIAL